MKAEHEIEIAMEEILNDLEEKTSLKVKHLKIIKEHDEEGPYYKVRISTSGK